MVQTPAPRLIEGLTSEQLCRRHAARVWKIARTVHRRLPRGAQLEVVDLVAYGFVGLLEARETYEPRRKIPFGVYVQWRIRGAMFDALRSEDPHPRAARVAQRNLVQARTEAYRLLERKPTEGDVAAVLGLDLPDYWKLMYRTRDIQKLSWDQQVTDGHTPASVKGGELVQGHIERQERYAALHRALEHLNAKDQQAVKMYYLEGKGIDAVAEVMGVTPGRISQRLKHARSRLRRHLTGQGWGTRL